MGTPVLRSVVIETCDHYRPLLSHLIKDHPSTDLAASYRDPDKAIRDLPYLEADLLFLDVEFHERSGFELLKYLDDLDDPPEVIIISGKKEHAFNAFKCHAADYLLKPFTREVFNSAVCSAMDRIELAAVKAQEGTYIFIRSNRRKHKIFLDDLLYIESMGDYAKIVSRQGAIVTHITMKCLTGLLPRERFRRIHKSFIVNLEKIENHNGKSVEVAGKSLPVGKRHKTEIRSVMSVA